MTTFQVVYDAFLAKILDDEWDAWTQSDMNEDLHVILEGAITHFKFPRVSLEYDSNGFTGNLTNAEIQVLANYMKVEWLSRTILRWENVKPLYTERDFSPAQQLKEFRELLIKEEAWANKVESDYYRSINGKPYSYSSMAT